MRLTLLFAFLISQAACLGQADCTLTATACSNPASSSSKELTSFAFPVALNAGQAADVAGVITGTSVALVVPTGTDVTSLKPAIVHSGASVSPASGAAQDFTSPVGYTVSAADGSTTKYTVVVSVAPASSKAITRFTILGVDGVISGASIALTVPSGTDVTSLTPTIVHTGASVTPASGAARDFTSPVAYTVTAADGSIATYTATVTVAPSSSKAITRFTILGVDGSITGTSIALTLPDGTDVTALTPTIVHTGASVSPPSGAATDFTNPVTFTVTAADGSTQAYVVTVRVAPSSAKAITQFTVQGVNGSIAGSNIIVALPAGTSVSSLTPTVVFVGGSVNPASGAAQNFSSPVDYVVTALDGSSATYSVHVLVAGTDAIDLTTAGVYSSPTDVASWPITTTITQIEERPSGARDDGLLFQFGALATWPDYTIPGWTGPLQYTVWPVVNINGTWVTAGIIQMWNGRASTGAPLLTDFAINWVYSGRWGPMVNHSPQVGEVMGFFVTAGNARDEGGVTSLRERSNVVLIAVPAGDTGMFNF